MTGVDVQTGRPIINEDSTPQSVTKPSLACPFALGGTNQPSGAYSPDTGAINAENGNMVWETILNGPVSGRPMTYSVGGRQYVAIAAGGVTQATGILEGLSPN